MYGFVLTLQQWYPLSFKRFCTVRAHAFTSYFNQSALSCSDVHLQIDLARSTKSLSCLLDVTRRRPLRSRFLTSFLERYFFQISQTVLWAHPKVWATFLWEIPLFKLLTIKSFRSFDNSFFRVTSADAKLICNFKITIWPFFCLLRT